MMMNVENVIEEIFEKFLKYLNKRDMEKLLSLFTETATVLGTGRDEYRNGKDEIRAQFERDWTQSEAGYLEVTRHVHSSRDRRSWGVCEFTAKITIDGKEHIFPNLRASIFLEEENGHMKIAHLHSSFPDPLQAEGESYRDES